MDRINWTERESLLDQATRLKKAGKTWEEVAHELPVTTTGESVRKAVSRHAEEGPDTGQGVSPGPLTHYREMLRERFPDIKLPEDVHWREWLDSFSTIQDLHKRTDPTQEFLTIDFSGVDRPIAIASASDLHMGGGYTSHRAIVETIDFILKTDDLYLGITGDAIEGFIPGEKSAETVEQQAGSLKAQLAALQSLVHELSSAGKLLWLSWGDHDAKWFEKLVGVNFVKQQVHDKAPYFQGRGLITLELGEQTYYICVNHAERFNSQWNRNHPQRRQYERFFPADINISGHKHKPAFQMNFHYEMLREAGLNLGGKHWLIANGTYKTGPDPYTIRGWTKGIIGVPTIVFHADEHDTDVFEDPEKADHFIQGMKKSG